MSTKQQQPAIPRFVAIPGEAESGDQYYTRIAQEQSARNQAKRGETLSLSDMYQAKRPAEQEQEEQHRQEQLAQLQANPGWSLTMLPRNDAMVVESRRKLLAHEQ